MDTWLSRAIEQEAPTSKSMIKWWEHVTEKTLEERKCRIKVVEQKKSIDRIKPSGRKNMIDSEHSNHKSQLSDDDVREDTATDQKQDMADSKRKHR